MGQDAPQMQPSDSEVPRSEPAVKATEGQEASSFDVETNAKEEGGEGGEEQKKEEEQEEEK